MAQRAQRSLTFTHSIVAIYRARSSCKGAHFSSAASGTASCRLSTKKQNFPTENRAKTVTYRSVWTMGKMLFQWKMCPENIIQADAQVRRRVVTVDRLKLETSARRVFLIESRQYRVFYQEPAICAVSERLCLPSDLVRRSGSENHLRSRVEGPV